MAQNKNFPDLIVSAIDWGQEHKDTIVATGIITILVLGLLIYFLIHSNKVRNITLEKISVAEGYVFNKMNNEALGMLNEIINASGKNSKESQFAILLKANVMYQMGNFKEAANLYSQLIEMRAYKNILTIAYSGLGYSEENLGNYSQATSAYTNFLDKFPEHYYTPRIYESLARVYELSGAIEQAKQTNEKIITLYPGTPWAKNAQEKNQYLQSQTPTKK